MSYSSWFISTVFIFTFLMLHQTCQYLTVTQISRKQNALAFLALVMFLSLFCYVHTISNFVETFLLTNTTRQVIQSMVSTSATYILGGTQLFLHLPKHKFDNAIKIYCGSL
jgi:hypothetical protein